MLSASNKHHEAKDKHAQRQEVGAPKTKMQLQIGRRNRPQRSDVDARIENKKDSLHGQVRVNDDPFAGL
jgi:hypothetical protein